MKRLIMIVMLLLVSVSSIFAQDSTDVQASDTLTVADLERMIFEDFKRQGETPILADIGRAERRLHDRLATKEGLRTALIVAALVGGSMEVAGHYSDDGRAFGMSRGNAIHAGSLIQNSAMNGTLYLATKSRSEYIGLSMITNATWNLAIKSEEGSEGNSWELGGVDVPKNPVFRDEGRLLQLALGSMIYAYGYLNRKYN